MCILMMGFSSFVVTAEADAGTKSKGEEESIVNRFTVGGLPRRKSDAALMF